MKTTRIQRLLLLLFRRHGNHKPVKLQKQYSSKGAHIPKSTVQTSAPPLTRLFNLTTSRWVVIPGVGAGLGYVAYAKFKPRVLTDTEEDLPQWQVNLYRKMPLKAMSRLWGKVNQFHLPLWLRRPVYRLYIWAFDCKLEEAAIEDLKHYNNLGEFFRRQLKPDVRPVDQVHCVTSPADGRVLHYGKVENGKLEQVKGVTYSLRGFLGPSTWLKGLPSSDIADGCLTDRDYHGQLKVKPGHSLHHCIIYLAPGDYHRFHSPVQWTMSFRRHFPGELLSVNPGVARWVQGLFNFNERAVYFGQWAHGFFSMTAVGATNVGSIKIYADKELCTNSGKRHPHGIFYDKQFGKKGIQVEKGEMFGEFNLGSTIVLIFEAPDDFDFRLEEGQKIRFGEPLGNCQLATENEQ
ncbi:phosphatidylserine decarboxylase proenzyme, mitochondrial-like isoform X2 [Liolophura sinensis]|uniref:phosphatidylserine decarboxylase proenzyme, mitochondrial-like isoform X2 n=1 Tax=Liolophura sinensis TaxID=3198878 RepID=UPI0031598F51